jgi:hypothetical protein
MRPAPSSVCTTPLKIALPFTRIVVAEPMRMTSTPYHSLTLAAFHVVGFAALLSTPLMTFVSVAVPAELNAAL